MPYRSSKQRAYLHANEPEVAARWDEEYGGKIVKKKSKGKGKAHIQRRAMKEGKDK